MQQSKKTVSIKDVAAYVGLSVGTVSMALNNSEKIADKTKSIVKKAAEELGFKKNPFARSLSTQSSGMVGCIVPDLTNNFYGEMIAHLQADLAELGYGLVVGCSNESSRLENKLIEQFLDKGVDGIISVPVSEVEPDLTEIKKLIQRDYPIVFISSYYREIPRYTVMCDLKDGMYKLAKNMFEQGHRNFVIITGNKKLVPSGERVDGLMKAVKEFDIKVDDSNFIEADKVTFIGGYSAINDIYNEKKPDLVLAINDIMAMGIISSLKSQKVRIPEDVSVTGFDDIAIAAFQETPLTTVSQSLNQMSKRAVKLLLDRINKESQEFGVDRVPAEVVLRKSTKAI
ncbi:LacI family DNA-binding transcriptional regulator [Bullifex porci]|uniref:LacI family DNA-binding transcriptional regulator n=1 Tax=Bullifex porci TaxID=2606638 RepID=UPI0023F49CD4|nr:LacI family DNA-binding transcriptional regulator [Bullifex porci]MDD7589157.1 LacI family DNA-binding transcriptional regulator [Bullifex porci]